MSLHSKWNLLLLDYHINYNILGVPAVGQWVKNLTAGALVTAEAWVPSPALCSGWKDLALPQLQHRSQLWAGFNPWPRNFHIWWMWPKKKLKHSKEKKSLFIRWNLQKTKLSEVKRWNNTYTYFFFTSTKHKKSIREKTLPFLGVTCTKTY